jgi:hypothetical protein
MVYPDQYFLGVYTSAVYECWTTSAPFTNPNYAQITYNGIVAVVRGFASYSTLLGYTGLNCWGQASGDNTCNWFYKTTGIGDLVIELSGCLVRTAPNIYAKDTITFLGNNDGSSLCLIGDTNTTTNPFGKASWWAFSQDGAVKYDSVTVDSGGINSIIAGTGISEVTNAGSVTISNTGVTQIIAGSNITITSTGTSGTGDVTINSTSSGGTDAGGYVKVAMVAFGVNNFADDAPHFNSYDPAFGQGYYWGGIAVNKFQNVAGGSINGIQYTGTNTIAVVFNLNPLFNVSTVAFGNAVNMLASPYAPQYQYSSFGINAYVTDANGALRTDQPVQTSMMCGAGATNSATVAVANDYRGVFSCSFIMRQNDIIKINAVSNGVFNCAGGVGANTLLFQGGSYVDGCYASVTCWEVSGV